MNKELTPLETVKLLKDFIFNLDLGNVDKLFVSGSLDIIEKELKALEIIKNIIKEGYLLLDYPTISIDVETSIGKQESNLLKKVLKDD